MDTFKMLNIELASEFIVMPVGDWWPKAYLWYGIASVVYVIRTTMRQRHDKEFPIQEVHYYLTSLPSEQAEQIAKAIREHWAIENGCHHVLDVTDHEDHCPVRDLNAAHNLTLMREISAKLIKDHPLKSSIRNKRKRRTLRRLQGRSRCPHFPYSPCVSPS
jgi:predicted transposase YbfD/YdcC